MAKLKSERHHWWPECVSEHWADEAGGVHWLSPNGDIRTSTPNNFGVIGNGHHIKLSPGVESPWDESFEREFNNADSNFPSVLDWLNGLDRCDPPFTAPVASRVVSERAPPGMFECLIECLASLAVRSPMHRANSVALAEHYRGPLAGNERNSLIGLNIRHSQRNAVKEIGGRGKAMVVFSPEREFIFGDGFFNNLTAPVQHLHRPKMFVPLTPWLAVLFARPMSYTVEPRVTTLMVTPEETDALNLAVQVYAQDAIFYRSERPAITDAFAGGKRLRFSDHRNSIDELIHFMPGVPARDTSLDALSALLGTNR